MPLTLKCRINSYPDNLIYLNVQSLEVVSRYRDPQPQVVENYSFGPAGVCVLFKGKRGCCVWETVDISVRRFLWTCRM